MEAQISKIDDLGNRSQRYNFRIRGLPEIVMDVHPAVLSLTQDLIPDIPPRRLELDRVHRALGPPRSDGLPIDIVVKPHYYAVKEEVMQRACSAAQLKIQDHPIQAFADFSPSTIKKKRVLKPLLSVLSRKDLKYWWLFLFNLKFSYKNKLHTFSRETPPSPGTHHSESNFSTFWNQCWIF